MDVIVFKYINLFQVDTSENINVLTDGDINITTRTENGSYDGQSVKLHTSSNIPVANATVQLYYGVDWSEVTIGSDSEEGKSFAHNLMQNPYELLR